jgi:hypothetical protein
MKLARTILEASPTVKDEFECAVILSILVLEGVEYALERRR